MKSNLMTKKSLIVFACFLAFLCLGSVLINTIMVRPALLKLRAYEELDEANDLKQRTTEEGFLYYILPSDDGNYITITGYDGKETEIEIPDNIDGIPVAVIDESAFTYKEEIKNVVVPEGVKNIATTAFAGCENLKTVTIIGLNTTIADYAFTDTKATICAKEGSLAQKYASDNNIKFESLS